MHIHVQYRSDARSKRVRTRRQTHSHGEAYAFTRARAYAFVHSSAHAKVESDAQCMKYNDSVIELCVSKLRERGFTGR